MPPDRIAKVLEGEVRELASIPAVSVVTVESRRALLHPAAGDAPAAPMALDSHRDRSGDPWEVLLHLGYERRKAREMLREARVQLINLGRAPTEDEIIQTAIRGRAVVVGGRVRSGRAENGADGEKKASGGPSDGRDAPREAPPGTNSAA